MSLIQLGFWAASGSAAALSYWLATLGSDSQDYGNSVATDSDGNSYVVGETPSGEGGDNFFIAKYNFVGEVQWQRTLGGSADDVGLAVALDSSANVYVSGYTRSEGAGSHDFLLAKYNSAGTIQWQRMLGGTLVDNANSVIVDSSGNSYIVGDTASTASGYRDLILAKYDSSGTLVFQRSLGAPSDHDNGQAVKLDSAGNVYAFGSTKGTGTGRLNSLLVKYNDTGTLQWQRVLGGDGNQYGNALAIDSSDNIYSFGDTTSEGAGGADFLVVKYNTSGGVEWQRILGGTSGEVGLGVAVDSLGNVYGAGWTLSEGEGNPDIVIAKWNSSGTIQWQRILGAPGTDVANSIAIDSLDNLYVFGYTNSTGAGGNDLLLAKLPADGSLTGTYVLDSVDFVYAASTLTAATSTLTAATPSLTAATSSLTDASASFTSHFVEIPT